MAGPRLVSELQGAAKRMVVGKAPDWVSFNGGVEVLMQQLRTCLGRPQVAELTDYLSQYFRHSRRRSGESINDYVTRKSELYMRAQQALSRVRPHQEATATAGLGSGDGFRGTQRRSSWTSETTTTTVPEGDDVADEAATDTGTTWNWEGASQGGGWTSSPTWGGYSGPSWWQSSSWNWAGSRDYAGYWPAKGLSDARKVELLPEWVQGWYLLQDAGLSTNERNVVFTALKGDFSVQKVAQELRNQWSEQDLKRRDQHQKASGYLGENAEDLEDDNDFYEAWKAGDQELQDADLNDEGSALIAEAEGEARQAWATLQHARRTLKEARQKQHQVRMSRKYYGPSGGGSKPNPRPRDDSQMTCMGCGKIGHRIANCPDKHKAHAAEAQEAAPFVCYVEQALAGSQGDGPTGPVPTTAEAVQDGWGVIDGGATRTLGSVQAIEAVMQKNMNKRGQSGIKGVDVENRPVFGFADSGEARCVSTVDLGLQANGQDGKLKVHALNKGTGPILISISTLRTLGAIIDFEQDMMVLRHLDARKVIPLRRSTTGHQLLNLTEDLYQDARVTKVQLKAAITTFGEIPAESWNMAELRHRLRELMDEQDIEWANPSAKRATPLQQQITQLNKNKKKKADLVEYLEKVLHLPVSTNETMAQMENRAMNYLYSTVQSTSQDIVGFGRHAHLTYAELVRDFPQYVEWVKQTHRETEETNVRLKRLATWLLRATDVSSPVRAEEPEPETAQTSGATSSRATPFPSEQMELMHGMMETMKQMQNELKEMKEQSLGSEAINQRSEAQRQELSEKRREAMKVYVGVCCVFHTCIQLGIHCTMEMADRCDAWRLPLFQRLRDKYSLWSAITKGCRVQLRDNASGKYSARGWRILTSHKRLSEQLDLLCRCDKAYKHAPTPGVGPSTKAPYTQDFTQRIAETMCQELSLAAVMKESLGESELPESFGEGETCTCGESKLHDFHLTCSNCVSDRESLGMVVDEAPRPEALEVQAPSTPDHQSLYSQSQKQQVEAIATQLLKDKRFRIQDAEQLLQTVADMKFGQQRSMARNESSRYQTFGMYSHGNHYGITSKTTILPQVTKYMNQWLREHLPKNAHWSSFVVSRNARLPVHRDNHNDPTHSNYLLGVGSYEGGELWVETPPGYEGLDACAQVSSDGKRLMGRKIPTLGQCMARNVPLEGNQASCIRMKHRTRDWWFRDRDFGAMSCLSYLQEGWMQYFGKPQVLRLDPAHWKLGVCEQAVKGVKEVMSKVCDQAPVDMLWEDPQGEIERSQPVRDFQAGELVYLWRSQTGQQ
ncbi:unnamed protein product, partial [Symbiodinium sp. KB8]